MDRRASRGPDRWTSEVVTACRIQPRAKVTHILDSICWLWKLLRKLRYCVAPLFGSPHFSPFSSRRQNRRFFGVNRPRPCTWPCGPVASTYPDWHHVTVLVKFAAIQVLDVHSRRRTGVPWF